MITEVLGLFDTSEQAEAAKQKLFGAGFESSDVKLQSNDAGIVTESEYKQDLLRGQFLIAVTASGNVDEDKAISILRECGASKINEIANRYHGEGTVTESHLS